MQTVLIAAVVFGLCFLVDRGFTRLFRAKNQHKTGLSVRHSKKYAAVGILLFVLGVAALFAAAGDMVLTVGGVVVIALGIWLIVYYMTFGIFYDDDSFVLTTLGHKSREYAFRDIRTQQLFASGKTVMIELYLSDGKSVVVQSGMEGVYPFLDRAFSAWCRQKGIDPESCAFHDPDNSLWFPTEEGE